MEEKVDGANSGIRFDEHGHMWLQSRGHFLTGGAREKHFSLFKRWADGHRDALHAVLGARYALYGEWLYAKHTVFYDRLSHYFLEYDVFDTEAERFLSTASRRRLLHGAPLASAAVLSEGPPSSLAALVARVGPSNYKSATWRASLVASAARAGVDEERAVRETDGSGEMEGLYIKGRGRALRDRTVQIRPRELPHGRGRFRIALASAPGRSERARSGRGHFSMTIAPPDAPDFAVTWDDMDRAFAWIRRLRDVPQDPIHHAEGDVWIHTRMVCEAMAADSAWRALGAEERLVTWLSALFHDVAKPDCTRIETDGRIHARGHSRRGAIMARSILWELGIPFAVRERVTALVRNHQIPFFAIEREDARRVTLTMSVVTRCDHLALLA